MKFNKYQLLFLLLLGMLMGFELCLFVTHEENKIKDDIIEELANRKCAYDKSRYDFTFNISELNYKNG